VQPVLLEPTIIWRSSAASTEAPQNQNAILSGGGAPDSLGFYTREGCGLYFFRRATMPERRSHF